MSIIDIREGYTGVEAGGSGVGAQLVLTKTRVFTVLTNDGADRGAWSFPQSHGGVTIPAPGTAHPDDSGVFSLQPQVTKKGPGFFDVKVQYQSPDPGGGSSPENPLSQPADISWDDAEYTAPYDIDMLGKPVLNPNLQYYDPPPTRSFSDPVLIIERNQATFDPDDKLTYQDTVSDATFYGASAGRARMGKIKARRVNAPAPYTPYWRVRYEIIFRMKTPEGVVAGKEWYRHVLRQGMVYRLTAEEADISKWVHTADGKPVLLDENGCRVVAADAATYDTFCEYSPASWWPLGL